MTRTLSRSLASVVEELELDQPLVVTTDQISRIAARHGIRSEPRLLAHRLREAGWLLPTGTRGVWEFAPGSHAGPFGHGDATTPLQSALAREPRLDAALALHTAAWAHGLADRLPTRLDVAVPDGTSVPAALARDTNVSRFTARLPYQRLKGTPTHAVETILVHLATSPTRVRWASVIEWIGDLAELLDAGRLTTELTDRTGAARRRTAYLLSGLRPDLADPLLDETWAGKVWFGPRGPLKRHDARWQIADTILPFDPAALPPVEVRA